MKLRQRFWGGTKMWPNRWHNETSLYFMVAGGVGLESSNQQGTLPRCKVIVQKLF